jgi:hypothetical protein
MRSPRPNDPFAVFVNRGLFHHRQTRRVWNSGPPTSVRPAPLGIPPTPGRPGYVAEVMSGRALVAPLEIRVARELDKIVAMRGQPGGIVSENGTELTSTAILAWSDRQKVAWHSKTLVPRG